LLGGLIVLAGMFIMAYNIYRTVVPEKDLKAVPVPMPA
jgi:cbb3-type cytochrome oxidase subunit 1